MHKYLWATLAVLVLCFLWFANSNAETSRKDLAERFFRGVYACDPSVVDELACDDVFLSYPIFEKLFGVSTIRGGDAVEEFAVGFCERWADPQIVIHDAMAEGNKVVLVWSFRGRNVGSADEDRPATNKEHRWGGITLYHFDAEGKITAEIGEESEPGPFERSAMGKATSSPQKGSADE